MKNTNSNQTTNWPTGNTTPVRTAILKISNDILWGMKAQSITSLVALDLSAAFNTINHEILLLYLAISMELKARHLNGSTSTSDLDPSRLPSMVLTAKRGT